MTTFIPEAIVGVLVCWIIATYAIWKWGPGVRKRRVRCPEKRLRARVLADQREADFASLQVVDVKACSLIAGAPLNCSKQCVSGL